MKFKETKKNSGKSTGPTTAGGKLAIRMNAAKHKLFSKVGDFGSLEDRTFLTKQLLHEYSKGLNGQTLSITATDETLIYEYVTCVLKLQHLDELQAGLMVVKPEPTEIKFPRYDPTLFVSGSKAWKLAHLTEKVRDCLTFQGEISEQLAEELSNFAPGWQSRINEMTMAYFRLALKLAREPEATAGRVKVRDDYITKIVNQIFEPQKQELHTLIFGDSSEDSSEDESEDESEDTSPDLLLKQLDVYGRYETTLTKKRDRVLAQLERRYRARNGEFMPPPTINIKI